MGTGLPLVIEVAFLVLVLPVAFAYLIAVVGLAAISVRAMLTNLFSRLRPGRNALDAHLH